MLITYCTLCIVLCPFFISHICFLLLTLCSKEIANFHRPKAKWYPHENKIAAQLQGAACSHGRMTAILMTLGGKGVKILVNAEDTPVSVKLKASKKLGQFLFTIPIAFDFPILGALLFSFLLLLTSCFRACVGKSKQMITSYNNFPSCLN